MLDKEKLSPMAAASSTISYPIKFYLRMVGVWPESSYLLLRRIFWFIFNVLGLMFQYWYIVVYVNTVDLPDLIDAISLTLTDTVAFVNLLIIWCNYRMFCNILSIIYDDWKDCASISLYKQLMMDNVNASRRVSNYLVGICALSCTSYLVAAWVSPSLHTRRKLFIKMEFPFDVMDSPIYEICLTTQVAYQNYAAFASGMFLALFAASALHVGGQINIMCHEIAHFSMTDQKYKGYISLAQFMTYILVLCCLGFLNVTSLGTEDQFSIIIKCVPFYVAVLSVAFVLCYTGEYLTVKSETINEAAFDVAWYKLRSEESRSFLLLLMRSTISLTLVAGKVVALSLETFASMLKLSASYVSVLLAMY